MLLLLLSWREVSLRLALQGIILLIKVWEDPCPTVMAVQVPILLRRRVAKWGMEMGEVVTVVPSAERTSHSVIPTLTKIPFIVLLARDGLLSAPGHP